MNFNDRKPRYFDDRESLDDVSRPDLITCPHCRGTGVVLRSKLSTGQVRKIELEESGELPQPRSLLDIPSSSMTQSKPIEPIGKELIPFHKNDHFSQPPRREPPRPFERGPGPMRNAPNYPRNDPGPSRADFYRRSDWNDDFGGDFNRNRWRGDGGRDWMDDGEFDDDLSKKRKRKKIKNKKNGPEFGNDEWNGPPFPKQPRSLMSDQVNPPMPMQRQGPPPGYQMPRNRGRGPNYDDVPGDRDELSDVDIFSLGVLYGNYMK